MVIDISAWELMTMETVEWQPPLRISKIRGLYFLKKKGSFIIVSKYI